MRLRMLTVIAAIAALVGSAAPALASRPQGSPGPAAGQLTAQIRYTTGGIPHILARNWEDLGFGYGYAFAKDNICTMANGYVTVEAQRARYFGPKGRYVQRGNGFARCLDKAHRGIGCAGQDELPHALHQRGIRMDNQDVFAHGLTTARLCAKIALLPMAIS